MPVVTAPTDLFMWPRNTVFFAGRGVAGATVFVRYENSSQSFSGAVSSNGNWAVEIPVADGSNRYRVWAEKDGKKSRELVFEFTRGTYLQRLQVATGERLEDTAFWRVVKGDPEDLGEFAASMGMDVVVIGDVRDIVKEARLFIVNDPSFSPTVFGLAALGILTTGEPNDVVVSATKNVYKAIAKLAKRSAKAAEAVLKTAKAIHALGKDVPLLSKVSALKALLKLALEDSTRLIKYVDEGGDEALGYMQRQIPKLFSVKPVVLTERLNHAWEHANEFAKVGITTKEQLKAVIEQTIATGRKGFYSYWRNGRYEDQLWFYDEARNIFIAVREEKGVWQVQTAFTLWQGLEQHLKTLRWPFEVK